jgi:hypothetical protein
MRSLGRIASVRRKKIKEKEIRREGKKKSIPSYGYHPSETVLLATSSSSSSSI